MKKLAIFAALILCITFAFAHTVSEDNYAFKEKISDTQYYPREHRVVTTTTYIDYENDKRYPTYDYRHGYTYRATKEYRDSYKVSYDENYERYYDRYDSRQYRDHNYRNYDDSEDGKIYYYEKSRYSDAMVLKSCYNYKPDKLFYIKC